MQSGSEVVQFPLSRMRDFEQQRDRALARLMLKRLDFERRVQRGVLNSVEIVREETKLTTELFSLARELDL